MAVEIIAEAAQGYEGDAALARLLARGAARAGADAVKFQLVYAAELATPDYEHYELFQSLEMPLPVWRSVRDESKRVGTRFYLDVFGERSLQDAVELGVDGVKIHASDFCNAGLVRAARAIVPRVYVGLGGVTVEELEEWLAHHGVTPGEPTWLLYGFQAEPTPVEANHLRRVGALRARFPGYRFGFMDHADGSSDEAMLLGAVAVALGVECIEKHITLDRALALEDYVSALAPERFAMFVRHVRSAEAALGTEDLRLTEMERRYREKTRKVVVASRALRKGETVTAESVVLKRVGVPHAPTFIERVEQATGRRLLTDVRPDDPITTEILG